MLVFFVHGSDTSQVFWHTAEKLSGRSTKRRMEEMSLEWFHSDWRTQTTLLHQTPSAAPVFVLTAHQTPSDCVSRSALQGFNVTTLTHPSLKDIFQIQHKLQSVNSTATDTNVKICHKQCFTQQVIFKMLQKLFIWNNAAHLKRIFIKDSWK